MPGAAVLQPGASQADVPEAEHEARLCAQVRRVQCGGDAMSDLSRYRDFLAAKAMLDPDTGIAEPTGLPDMLFDFQADITRWSLKRGRAALFAGTGLGKSLMELAWADAV